MNGRLCGAEGRSESTSSPQLDLGGATERLWLACPASPAEWITCRDPRGKARSVNLELNIRSMILNMLCFVHDAAELDQHDAAELGQHDAA